MTTDNLFKIHNLKQLRDLLHLKNHQVAKILNANLRTVEKWLERPDSTPAIKAASRLRVTIAQSFIIAIIKIETGSKLGMIEIPIKLKQIVYNGFIGMESNDIRYLYDFVNSIADRTDIPGRHKYILSNFL